MSDLDYTTVTASLVGSLLSILGTSFILICYLTLPHTRHIRHALIINLTIADFINAVNNSSSGLWVAIKHQDLAAGPGCTINGYIGQLSVQAVDFSIFAITVVTLWIVVSARPSIEISTLRIFLICGSTWVVPVITSNIALILGAYGPASSNWCWIEETPTYLRYVLTHGWRFLIILAVALMCIYLQLHLHNFFERQVSGASKSKRLPNPSGGGMHLYKVKSDSSTTGLVQPDIPVRATSNPDIRREKTVRKALLLNVYPTLYLLLWIPGIIERISEATGHNSRILGILQSSTQYIGFANALTFGWNEKIGTHLKERFNLSVKH